MSDGPPPKSVPSSSTQKQSTSPTHPPPQLEWVCIGHESTFGARTTIKVHKRRVTVMRLKTRRSGQPSWYCIDTICYHAGGPLTDGAVRTIGDRVCLQCPWHSYLVDVETGEGLYMDLDRSYQSKGLRQRVHDVEVRENQLWVRLRLGEKEVPSDDYAYGPRFRGRPEEEEDIAEFPDW